MKKLLIISSLITFIACGGENLKENPNDPYKKIEEIQKRKEVYTPHLPINYQKITVPSKLKYYYQSINFNKNGEALKEDLAILTITKHTKILAYGERHPFLEKANADPNNPQNILLVYTGESRPKSHIQKRYNSQGDVNTEHIYPQSYLKKYNNPESPLGDLHHLQYIDSNMNSSRGNLPYGEGKGEANRSTKGKFWYPSDEYKGDIARMIMYMYLRYNLPWNHVSTEGIGLFLKWNAEDRVSPLELQRNNEIEQAQGNRNPFIDNPYLATKIFGEIKNYSPENSWK
ncbi:endonuclease I family protein [Capnocytophaga sp. G2]|uniref:endonuclease I family protein n=1 Tax=Capnocytophaga sp. G2 TaxID=3110695 RepID=UPI002B495B88|nr:endonuclease [Capnocytophaga sp. G2]MEB3004503.1 endonuclease [Capnocytophaga sp. G2]